MQTHTVQLDRERRLVYDFAAFRRIENLTGASFLTGQAGHVPTSSMEYLLVVLWAGLLEEDPKLTLEQVEAMLTMDNVVAVDIACGQAIQEALGKALGAAPAAPEAKEGSESP